MRVGRARRRRQGPRVGLVNWPADLAAEAVDAAAEQGVMPPCAAQLPYSLVRRSLGGGCRHAAGAGVVGRGPGRLVLLAGGVLTGKYRDGEAAGRAAGALGEPRYAAAAAAAGDLARLAARLGTTAAALALAFPLTNPAVASVLFGATSPEQLRANCAAAGLLDRLDPDDVAGTAGHRRGLIARLRLRPSCKAALIASTAWTVGPAAGLRAVGQVDSFATTVCDGTWTKTFCPLMPGAVVERHAPGRCTHQQFR